jgi:hypothetical protein
MNPPASFNVSLTGTHAMREAKHLPTRKPVACLCIASGPLPVAGARDVR